MQSSIDGNSLFCFVAVMLCSHNFSFTLNLSVSLFLHRKDFFHFKQRESTLSPPKKTRKKRKEKKNALYGSHIV